MTRLRRAVQIWLRVGLSFVVRQTIDNSTGDELLPESIMLATQYN